MKKVLIVMGDYNEGQSVRGALALALEDRKVIVLQASTILSGLAAFNNNVQELDAVIISDEVMHLRPEESFRFIDLIRNGNYRYSKLIIAVAQDEGHLQVMKEKGADHALDLLDGMMDKLYKILEI